MTKRPYHYVPEYLPNMLPPMKPGVYLNLAEDIYHRIFAASQSWLKCMGEFSPGHVLYKMQHPTPSTPTQIFGRRFHAALLEPVRFAREYSVAGQCTAATKAGSQCSHGGQVRVKGCWYCNITSHIPAGATPDPVSAIAPEEMENFTGMQRRLLAGEHTGRILAAPGDNEVSIFWEDVETGVPCKARLDRVVWDLSMVFDPKSTTSAKPSDFDEDIARYGYHLQAAHNLYGLRAVGRKVDKFLLMPVEKKAPWEAGLVFIDKRLVDDAHVRLTELLSEWRECVEAGTWPGYNDAPRYCAELPRWASRTEKEVVLA